MSYRRRRGKNNSFRLTSPLHGSIFTSEEIEGTSVLTGILCLGR